MRLWLFSCTSWTYPEELGDGIVGGQHVTKVGGEEEAVAELLKLPVGDDGDGDQELVVAGLQGVSGMQADVVLAGGDGAERAVEFEFQAEKRFQR